MKKMYQSIALIGVSAALLSLTACTYVPWSGPGTVVVPGQTVVVPGGSGYAPMPVSGGGSGYRPTPISGGSGHGPVPISGGGRAVPVGGGGSHAAPMSLGDSKKKKSH